MSEIGIGQGARVTRAQKATMDLTGNQARDTEIIQCAIDEAVAEALAPPPEPPPVVEEELVVETTEAELVPESQVGRGFDRTRFTPEVEPDPEPDPEPEEKPATTRRRNR